MQKCKHCGSKMNYGSSICPSCGKDSCAQTSNPLEEMNLLSNESNNQNPFSKMDEARSYQSDTTSTIISENELPSSEDTSASQHAQAEAEREYIRNYNSLSNNYVLGFAGAIVGALVGTIPWIIASCAGWFVAWLGYLIAVAAAKGYDLLKVKPSKFKFWGIIIGVVIGVFFGQIGSDIASILIDPEFNGYDASFLISIYFDNFSEIVAENSANLLLGYVFAALGSFSALKNIKKEIALIDELKAKYPGECYEEN